MLKRQKIEAGQNLKPEPSPDEPGVIRVMIKLPTGTRLERRFLNSDSLLVNLIN
jgi:FAS-associated factor 2